MFRFLSPFKISTSMLVLIGASLGAPNALSDETALPPAAVQADAQADIQALGESAAPAPDYTPMKIFMQRASANQRGRPSIAYKKLRKEPQAFFDEYEAYLVSIDASSLSETDQLAYWLNLQNFLVVKAITEDTKKSNLKKLRGTGAKPGKLWTTQRVTVNGQSYSIADIETKIITDFNNQNVLYGIYQGVKGGPCLSRTPYEGESVHERLDELAKQYVNSNGIVVPQKRTVSITPVYDWYSADLFGGDEKLLLTHLKTNATTRLRGRLNTVSEIDFSKLNYDGDVFIPVSAARAPSRSSAQSRPTSPPPSGGSGGGGGGGFGS